MTQGTDKKYLQYLIEQTNKFVVGCASLKFYLSQFKTYNKCSDVWERVTISQTRI